MRDIEKFPHLEKFLNLMIKWVSTLTPKPDSPESAELGRALVNRILDLPGPRSLVRKSSKSETEWAKIFGAVLDMSGSLVRMELAQEYIKGMRLPGVHPRSTSGVAIRLQYHFEKTIDESYIVQNRLLRISDILRRRARTDERVRAKLDSAKVCIITMPMSELTRVRGLSIHESRFEDPRVARISMLELLAKNDHLKKPLSHMLRTEFRVKRRQVLNDSEQIRTGLLAMVDSYFGHIHDFVFTKQGTPRLLVDGRVAPRRSSAG